MHDREWTNEDLEQMVIGAKRKRIRTLDPNLIDYTN